jgi:hypothetical protein
VGSLHGSRALSDQTVAPARTTQERTGRDRVGTRFMVQTRRGQSPWVVIVEPDADVTLLVVVTAYEVSQ